MRISRQLQLPFPGGDDAARLTAASRLRLSLEARIGESVKLTITDNRHTIVSVRTRPDGVHSVRVHHMFLQADPTTVKSLARYVARRDRRSSKELGRFISDHKHMLRTGPPRTRSVLVRTRGKHFDLQELYDDLNRRCFDTKVQARITWGPMRKRGPRSSIKMGTYCLEDRLIRVHPLLDQDWIPRYFLEWVVHHEMLHDLMGVTEVDGKRVFHPPQFREREQAFEHYERARRWERKNLDKLLRG